jgi:hypothetical protein
MNKLMISFTIISLHCFNIFSQPAGKNLADTLYNLVSADHLRAKEMQTTLESLLKNNTDKSRVSCSITLTYVQKQKEQLSYAIQEAHEGKKRKPPSLVNINYLLGSMHIWQKVEVILKHYLDETKN